MGDLTTDLAKFLQNLPAFAPIKRATVTLTDTNIKALRATPITLVAIPNSATKKNVFVGASLKLTATAGAYTETTDNLAIRYTSTTGVIVSQAIEMTGFIDQAAVMHTNAEPKVDGIATNAQCANLTLVLHNTGDGEFGGGNAANTLVVTTLYYVQDI